jgi:GntR family transcriptional regulator / MocR family aminotransferase
MLTYSFANRGELGLYEHLYQCIKADIEQGRIAPDEKMPSKRTFAKHLGVSLITVEGAYAQLIAEGYLRSEPRRGYYACNLGNMGPRHASRVGALAAPERIEEYDGLAQAYASLASHSGNSGSTSFASAANVVQNGKCSKHAAVAQSYIGQMAGEGKGLAAPAASDASRSVEPMADFTGVSEPAGLFPYGAWAKSVREALTCEPEKTLVGQVPAAGTERLRKAIAEHLRGFRGMEVDPGCIVIGAGSQVLYNLVVQLLGRGLTYGVENPGYARLRQIYQANDVRLALVPLDAQGVQPEAVRSVGVDVLHLMPSHQYPTGVVVPISRRYELLGWASEAEGRCIIEDDYDCEFRLTGRPIPSLQSIDALGKVIYVNTFTKSLGPAFRIGYMVLPPALAQRFHNELGFYSCTVSAIDQLALARFIESGDYERHVNRMRTYYRSVRDELVGQLQQSKLAGRMSIEAQDAGIHFLLGLQPTAKAEPREWEQAFTAAAAEYGVVIRPVSSFYAQEVPRAQHQSGQPVRFVVSYGGVAEEAIPQAVQALEKAAAVADGL